MLFYCVKSHSRSDDDACLLFHCHALPYLAIFPDLSGFPMYCAYLKSIKTMITMITMISKPALLKKIRNERKKLYGLCTDFVVWKKPDNIPTYFWNTTILSDMFSNPRIFFVKVLQFWFLKKVQFFKRENLAFETWMQWN